MTESVETPERIWIESTGECPYYYHEEELSDVAPPITEYVRADKLRAEIEALRAERDALVAENVRLREDAERWRALREMDGGEIYALLGDCDGVHPEQADAAIDQARGNAGQEVGNG